MLNKLSQRSGVAWFITTLRDLQLCYEYIQLYKYDFQNYFLLLLGQVGIEGSSLPRYRKLIQIWTFDIFKQPSLRKKEKKEKLEQLFITDKT